MKRSQPLPSTAAAVDTWSTVGQFNGTVVGGMDREIVEHFFYSVCSHAGITAHIIFSGKNDHHQCEAIFKAFGIALGEAVSVVHGGSGDIPSTKGVL